MIKLNLLKSDSLKPNILPAFKKSKKHDHKMSLAKCTKIIKIRLKSAEIKIVCGGSGNFSLLGSLIMDIQKSEMLRFQTHGSPFIELKGDISGGVLITCDHATAYVPDEYAHLGLPQSAFNRHIAYDPGVREVAEMLNSRFQLPVILSNFSRLLIDPNRGEDDPTLIMQISDGQPVPGNINIDETERSRRLERFYVPYHAAITRYIDTAIKAGKPPVLLSIHSFTPIWRGVKRPWEAAILWDNDPRFALLFMKNLREVSSLKIGDNEPYTGRLKGDSMFKHGTSRGLAHSLLEIRQDLLSSKKGIEEWCEYIIKALQVSLQAKGLHEIKQYGSLAK